MAALVVLALIGALYAGPVQKELRVSSELAVARHQVELLQREQAHLRQQASLLQTRQGEILAARSCGWTLPGERPVIVQGLPGSCG